MHFELVTEFLDENAVVFDGSPYDAREGFDVAVELGFVRKNLGEGRPAFRIGLNEPASIRVVSIKVRDRGAPELSRTLDASCNDEPCPSLLDLSDALKAVTVLVVQHPEHCPEKRSNPGMALKRFTAPAIRSRVRARWSARHASQIGIGCRKAMSAFNFAASLICRPRPSVQGVAAAAEKQSLFSNLRCRRKRCPSPKRAKGF